MMYHCRFIDCNLCPTLVEVVDNGAGCTGVGSGGTWEISVLSSQCCNEPKTALKKVFKYKKKQFNSQNNVNYSSKYLKSYFWILSKKKNTEFLFSSCLNIFGEFKMNPTMSVNNSDLVMLENESKMDKNDCFTYEVKS